MISVGAQAARMMLGEILSPGDVLTTCPGNRSENGNSPSLLVWTLTPAGNAFPITMLVAWTLRLPLTSSEAISLQRGETGATAGPSIVSRLGRLLFESPTALRHRPS